MEKVYWLEDKLLKKLADDAENNTEKYLSGNFDVFFDENRGLMRDVGVSIDLDIIKQLSGLSANEPYDSVKIFSAIKGITPSLAVRGNLWSYLSHSHLLSYGRKRWLDGEKVKEKQKANITQHFLKVTPGTLRDDHCASRPWWTAYIGSRIAHSNESEDIQSVLEILARTTDTRSSSIERPSVFGDIYLARLIVRHLKTEPSLSTEIGYRSFMKKINFLSNGVKFSGMNYQSFVERFC